MQPLMVLTLLYLGEAGNFPAPTPDPAPVPPAAPVTEPTAPVSKPTAAGDNGKWFASSVSCIHR